MTQRLEGGAGERFTQRIVLRNGGAVLRGVVRAAGVGCADAVVEIRSDSCDQTDWDGKMLPPAPPLRLRTRPDGTFEARGVALWGITVLARAPGFATWVGEVRLRPDEASNVEISLAPAISVSGVVRDEDGHGVVGASVQCANGRADYFSLSETRTDASGEFRLDDVTPGEVLLSYRLGERCGAQWTKVERSDQRVELILAAPAGYAGGVSGVVVDGAGKPLAGWPVALVTRGYSHPACTDEHGRFRIGLQNDTLFDLHVRNPSDRLGVPLHVTRNVRRGAEDLRIVVADTRMASLRVRFVDEGRDALARIELSIEQRSTAKSHAVHSGPDGNVVLTNLSPSLYRIRARSPERGTVLLAERELKPGEDLDLGTVQLPRAATLHVSIRAENGNTPRYAGATVYDERGERVCFGNATHPEGAFDLGPLAPGSYVAHAQAEGLAATRFPITVRAGETPRVEWRLAAGVACTFQVEEPGPPRLCVNVTLRVRDGAGAEIVNVTQMRMSDAPIELMCSFAPGTYRVELEAADGRRGQKTFTIAAGQPAEVSVELR